MKLYYFPVSTYSQKALLALHEKGIEFVPQYVNLMDKTEREQYREIYPIGKIPLLKPSEDYMVPESSIIIEYLQDHFPEGSRLIPKEMDAARRTRFVDRLCDLYLNNPTVELLFEGWKPQAEQDEEHIAKQKRLLDAQYSYMDKLLADNTWLMGEEFTLADCAAIPPLYYAQKLYPFTGYKNLAAYFARALERPSYQKVLAEARPILEQMGL
jgi:glutathione S-transferase